MIKEYSMRFNQNLLADLDWNFILVELESEESSSEILTDEQIIAQCTKKPET